MRIRAGTARHLARHSSCVIRPLHFLRWVVFCAVAVPCALLAQGVVTVQLTDYAAVPRSGTLDTSSENAVYIARVNFLREEPGGGLNRFFVCDLNGKLYILDKT